MSSKKHTQSRTNGFEDVFDGQQVAAMESLEPRILLTTLYSGDVFEFLARTDTDSGEVYRVTVGGNDTIVEILGSGLYDWDNSLRVVDVPGEITSSSIAGRAGMRVHGGIGGFDNIVPVGNGNITIYGQVPVDPADPAGPRELGPINRGDPEENINVSAIATDPTTNLTYALNMYVPQSDADPGWLTGQQLNDLNLDSNDDVPGIELLLLDTSEQSGGQAVQILPNIYHHIAHVLQVEQNIWAANDDKDYTDDDNGQGDEYEQIVSVTAADFNPLDGKLYFCVTGGGDEIPVFFSVDVNSDDPMASIEVVMSIDVSSSPTSVNSLAFDRFFDDATGDVNAKMWVATYGSGDAQLSAYDAALFTGPQSIPQAPLSVQTVSLPNMANEQGPDEIDEEALTGIDFVTDTVDADGVYLEEEYLFAIASDGDDSRLLRVDLNSGEALNYGKLSDGFDRDGDNQGQPADHIVQTGDARGENLGGLTYHPNERNPFTGRMGVLYATDTETDELVMIYDFDNELEARHWGDADENVSLSDAFMVYVVQGDGSGHISVARVEDDDFTLPGIRPSTPYSDDVDPWVIINPNTAVAGLANVPSDSGQALLGTRQYDRSVDPYSTELTIPVTSLPILSQIGVIHESLGVTSSGLLGMESLLEYASNAGWNSRTLGQNLDDVRQMAISRDGQYVVVDVDGVDETGAYFYDDTGDGMRFYDTWEDPNDPTTGNGIMEPGETLKQRFGDQIAIVNPVTGQAGTPVYVTNAADGSFLSGIQGLDYGDPGQRGYDDLYAIYNLSNASNVNPTVEFDGTGLGSLLANLKITGLAVSDGNYVYAIDEDTRIDPDLGVPYLRLVRIERSGSQVSEILDLGRIMDAAGNSVQGVKALEFHNGTLYAVGQLEGNGAAQILFTISTTASDIDAAEDYNPDAEVGLAPGDGQLVDSTGVGVNFNIIDITVDSLGTMFAVADDPIAGFVRLLQITQTASGAVQVVNDLGRIVDNRGAAIVDVQSIDAGSGNALTIVGRKSANGVNMIFNVPRVARDVSGNTAGSAPDGQVDELVVTGVAYPGLTGVTNASTWAALGVNSVVGQNDFSIRSRFGDLVTVNLDDHATVSQLADYISAQSGANLRLTVAPDGKGLILTDSSLVPLNNLTITSLNDSTAANDLGLIADSLDNSFLPNDSNNDGVYDTMTQNVSSTFIDTDNDGFAETLEELVFTGAAIFAVTDPITAIAFSDDSATIYAALDVAGAGGADSQLLVINATTGVMTNEGDIITTSGNTEIIGLDINVDGDLIGLDADNGEVIVVNVANPAASTVTADNPNFDADLVGYASDTNGNFFSILDDGVDNYLYVKNVVDEIEATSIGALGGTNPNDPITGLAIDSSDNVYAILDLAGGGGNDSQLITININTGAVISELGQIFVGGANPAEISGIDFNGAGQLVGLDVLNRQIVDIDTATPGNSTAFVAGFISPQLVGYSYDSARPGFFSVFDDNTNANKLMVTNDASGLAPTLGIIDPATGQFSAIDVIDPDGLLDLTLGEHIQTMAFSNTQQLFILDSNGVLYRANFSVNSSTGQITAIDSLTVIGTVQYNGSALTNVSSMDFDINSDLFIHDKSTAQLLDIDYRNPSGGIISAGVNTATTEGTLRPTVGAISYNATARKFSAVDNAPGSLALADSRVGGQNITQEGNAVEESAVLMDLTGTTSDAPVAQSLNAFLWGGPIMGQVNFSGSMDTFYAGWLITGNAGGVDTSFDGWGVPVGNFIPNNFIINGDLHNLVTAVPIGTSERGGATGDLDYYTGVDIHIGGRLGQVLSSGETYPGDGGADDGSIIANIHVYNNEIPVEDLTSINFIQEEVEEIMTNAASDENQRLTAAGAFNNGDLLMINGGWLSNDPTEIDLPVEPDRAQVLGALRNSAAGINGINVSGTIHGETNYDDWIDYYAVALMAGQTITTQLIAPGAQGLIKVGIYNSEGQLVATDYSNVDPESVYNLPFQYTTETPGIYYFAIGFDGDFNFNGNADDWEQTDIDTDLSAFTPGTYQYNLQIQNVGDLAFGGAILRGEFGTQVLGSDAPGLYAVDVYQGDFGGFETSMWDNRIHDASFNVANGNLRALIGQSLGDPEITDGWPGFTGEIVLNVPFGNVGLLRSTDFGLGLNLTTLIGAIGGDYQWIDAAQFLYGRIVANGSIGTILAGDMGTNVIQVNAAGDINRPGTIDLIDVTGDFGFAIGVPVPDGMPTGGGPQISTGPGGNVRYIRVGGEIYQDTFYGGGDATPGLGFTSYEPGHSAQIRDDSGTMITVTPVGYELTDQYFVGGDGYQRDDQGNILFDPITNEPIPRYAGAIEVLRTYGIRGSGGVVVIDMIVNSAVNIRTDSHDNNGTAEITNLLIEGNGRGLEIGPDGNIQMVPDDPEAPPYDNRPLREDITVTVTGNSAMDFFSLQTYSYLEDPEDPNSTRWFWAPTSHYSIGGSITSFINKTGGELVNMYAGSVGRLDFAGSIGVPTRSTDAMIQPNINEPWISQSVINSVWPFTNHKYAIISFDGFGVIESDQAIGNILAINMITQGNSRDNVGAVIGRLVANADKVDDPDVFEGIAGPIFSSGDMFYINVGEGLAASGSGEVVGAGLYAGEVSGGTQLNGLDYGVQDNETLGANIRMVVADNPYANIYGDIVAYGDIENIRLTNGASIVNADIMVVGDENGDPDSVALMNSREYIRSFQLGPTWSLRDEFAVREENASIGKITVSGGGGIIGMYSTGQNIGDITVSNDGFGMLNSRLRTARNGDFGKITVGGYGIRSVIFDGGINLGQLYATGKGESSSTINYSPTVRLGELVSQLGDYDNIQYFKDTGHSINRLTDINEYLGTDANNREILDTTGYGQDVTATGVIEGVEVYLLGNLGKVDAYQIRAHVIEGNTIFHVANDTNSITVRDKNVGHYSINGFEIVTGQLGKFMPGASVNNLSMTVAGLIKDIRIKGDLLGTSFIEATGPNGDIKKITIDGNMEGDIVSSGRIGTIEVKGNLIGNLTVSAVNSGRYALKKLTVHGSLTIGSLDINGSVGTIKTYGSFGSPGESLVVNGNLDNLYVGVRNTPATVGLDMTVLGDLGKVMVYGQIDGSLLVDGTLKNLDVRASGGPAISSPINVRGSLTSAKVTNGNVLGDIAVAGKVNNFMITDGDMDANLIAGDDLNKFSIRNGDLTAGSEVGSSLGNVKNFEIRGGDLEGTVTAANGEIGSIRISGSDMGDQASILAKTLKSLRIDGNIEDGATINVVDLLTGVTVGGNVEQGVTITAGSASKLTFNGDMLGDLQTGRYSRGTSLSVKGNLGSNGGAVSIDADTKLSVSGDINAGTTVSVGGDLSSGNITGDINGDLFVDGQIKSLKAAGMNNAMLTAGFNVNSMTFSDAITNSLIQIGITRNARGRFDASISRMADIKSFTANDIVDSIVAVGGHVNKVSVKENLTDSVIASGLSLGATAMEAVRTGALTVGVDNAAILSGADRQLFHGDIKTVTAGTMTDSSVAAGVDPVNGVFGDADDSVTTPGVVSTGGTSTIGSINAKQVAGDNVVTSDSGVSKSSDNLTPEAPVNDATFIDDITVNNPLVPGDLVATIGADNVNGISEWTVTVNGIDITIAITGNGSIDIYNDAATLDRLDTLVLRDTDSRTKVTVTTADADTVGLGRVIVNDDATVGSFTFNGDLLGDGSADADLWLDGDVKDITFRNMSVDNGWSGRIGGDVSKITIDAQGNGRLVIGGQVKTLTVEESHSAATSSLVEQLSNWTYGNEHITQMATNAAGTTFVIDTASDGSGVIYEVDLTTGLPNNTITPLTLLASLHGGRGVGTVAGDDMRITMASGNTVTVDLSAAVTIQDVIDTIGASLPNVADVTVEINDNATGLKLTDNTVGGSTFAITALSGSTAAADLGIEQTDSDDDGIIEGALVIGAPIDNRFTGEALELLGMDFNEATGELIAIAELLNYNPTQFIGNLSNRPLSLKGLAVSSDGRIVAAESAEFTLVDGDLGADYDIRAITIDNNDDMYAVHRNGVSNNFELYRVDRDSATGEITDFVLLGEITDMVGNVVRDIEAIETDPNTGELKIIGIRPAVGAGDVQELFTLDPTTVDTDGNNADDGEVVATQIAGIAEYLQITNATLLSDLNYASGVDSDGTTLPEILIRNIDGTTAVIDIDELGVAPTVGDLINLINGDPRYINTTAAINAAGTGLEFADILVPADIDPAVLTTFEILSLGGSTAAEDLGIAQIDSDGNQVITGTPINPAEITDTIQGLAVDANGNYFAVRDFTGVIPTVSTLLQIDPTNVGQTPQGRNVIIVSDLSEIKVGGDNTVIRGIDFADDGQLIGQDFSGGAGKTRRILIDNIIPTASAFMTPEGSDSDDSRGLASDAQGRFYVVDAGTTPDTILVSNTLRDRLIEINPDTGGIVNLGYMRDFYGNYLVANTMQLAFTTGGINGQDKLLILINDRDGNGPSPISDGVAMAAVDWTDEAGNGYLLFTDPTDPARDALPINGIGGELLEFTGMAVDSNGIVYAIRRNAGDTADELVTLTSFNANTGLQALTPLSSLNNGQGVGIVEDGLSDVRIQLRDGSTFDVILDGANNVQDVIDLINAAAAGVGAPADLMQLGVGSNLIMFDDLTPIFNLQATTLLNDLDNRYNFRSLPAGTVDFTITDPGGNTYDIDLDVDVLTTDVQDVIDAIDAASAGVVTAEIETDADGGYALRLNYHGSSYLGFTLSVATQNGSLAAVDLGLADATTGTGSAINEVSTSFIGEDIRPKLLMMQANGSTAATDLGFPDTNVATSGSNFEQVDGLTLSVGASINEDVIGEISVDGNATTIVGIGFDHLGNLVAFNNDATTELIGLTSDNFADASLFEYITSSDLLAATHDGIDAFAISSLAGDNLSFAYDTSKSGTANGELFVSPGMTPTMGTIDLSGGSKTGGMFQLLPLASDDAGTAVTQTVSGLAVDNDGTGNIYVVTDEGMFLEYDATTGTIVGTGPVAETLVDATTGATLNIKSIDFNDAGNLIAIDSRFNTLYHLVTVDGMPDGAVRGNAEALLLAGQLDVNDLTTLTYDPVAADFYSFRDSDNAFVRLLASTQSDADALTGGIDANSINTINIGSELSAGYNGRISTSANTIKTVKVTGDFGGMLVSSGDFGNFTMLDGDFSGSLMASGSFKSIRLTNGDITSTGVISTNEELKRLDQRNGDFAGQIAAASAGSLKFSGEGLDTADIIITETVKTISFGGDYAGRISVGDFNSLTVGDDLGATAVVNVTNCAGTINIKDDAFAGSLITVGKSVKNLTIGDDLAGIVAIGDGLNNARIGSMTSSILMVGGYTRTININGAMDSALISIGTWLGADGIYNTEDDVIVGGTVRTVSVRGDFTDSAVVAGVLPSLTKGAGVPTDKRAYVGTVSGNVLDSQGRIVGQNIIEDSAEAGGGVVSVIESLSIRGDVLNTNVANGQQSVVAAADGIGKLTGPEIGRLTTRIYSDPLGAPYMIESIQLNASAFHGDEFRITFSEEVNTDSFVLSIDGDDDGQISSAADVFGSILITDANGNIVDDGVTIGYTTQIASTGVTQGVLRLLFNDGFAGLASPLTVSLSTDINNIMIYDRSGSRSVLRDFNQDGEINGQPAGIETPFGGEVVPADPSEDPFKTILTGSGSVVFIPSDMPNDFDLSLAENSLLVNLDGGMVSVIELMNSDYDVDIFRIEGLLAGQFLTAEFAGLQGANLAIFHQDTQGTASVDDDYFEIVARFENIAYDNNDTVFQAVELAEDGDYFVAVAGFSGTGYYQMNITLSSSDDVMATQLGGTLGGDGTINLGYGNIETIGYVNNIDNAAKQLVYLNFDGGQPTDYEPHENVIFEAFDPAALDDLLEGYGDELIYGSADVTGIIDNVLAVYNDLPATALDAAGLPADFELAHYIDLSNAADLAAYEAATDGIWFTTIDPASYGYDVNTDYNTGFIGQADGSPFAPYWPLLGIASNIDMMNMHKSDDFLVFSQIHSNIQIIVDPVDPTDALNQYSSALAFTVAHELGHTLGLNHQPVDYTNFYLLADDPDNDPGTLDDSNTGIGLMAYPTDVATFDALAQLGTSDLAAREFTDKGYADVDGYIDTLTLLLRWLA